MGQIEFGALGWKEVTCSQMCTITFPKIFDEETMEQEFVSQNSKLTSVTQSLFLKRRRLQTPYTPGPETYNEFMATVHFKVCIKFEIKKIYNLSLNFLNCCSRNFVNRNIVFCH